MEPAAESIFRQLCGNQVLFGISFTTIINMRALVTGPGGFLARYIVKQLLERGDFVRGFARRPQPKLESAGMEMVRGDLSDESELERACEGIDCVFHVAAISGIGEPWSRYYQTNTVGAYNVLTAAVKQSVPYFLYTSSPSVVFGPKSLEKVDETTPYPRWYNSHYARSKALAEQRVLEYNGRTEPSGQTLRTCSLRPHLMWGPGDEALIPRLIQRAQTGRLRQVGQANNLVDILYVENAAEAHVQAADAIQKPDSPLPGKKYFLSQGTPVNVWGWINELLALYGEPPVSRRISFSAAYYAGAAFEAIWKLFRWVPDPPMTRFLAQQLALSFYFDISAAERDFGFRPKISKEEGMERLKQSLVETGMIPGAR